VKYIGHIGFIEHIGISIFFVQEAKKETLASMCPMKPMCTMCFKNVINPILTLEKNKSTVLLRKNCNHFK
jgi:hypothetical protein